MEEPTYYFLTFPHHLNPHLPQEVIFRKLFLLASPQTSHLIQEPAVFFCVCVQLNKGPHWMWVPPLHNLMTWYCKPFLKCYYINFALVLFFGGKLWLIIFLPQPRHRWLAKYFVYFIDVSKSRCSCPTMLIPSFSLSWKTLRISVLEPLFQFGTHIKMQLLNS